ncbi:hypothetical protein FRC04_002056 [Tulasnella sp. 424]|nr:hypothetical protein FRC04_002056 [Tulasnella sp. 424]KAG8975550.1 hypothetical protein FRC05_005619 [Tulasnella sp. 425]
MLPITSTSTTSGRTGGWFNATLRSWTGKLARALRVKNKSDLPEGQVGQVLNAEAACWLLEMTSDLADQLTVVQEICSMESAGYNVVLAHPAACRRLLNLTLDALQIWQDQPTPANRTRVERFGAALALVMLKCGESETWAKHLGPFLLDRRDLFVSATASLDHLQYVLTGKFTRRPVASNVERSMMIVFLRTMILKEKKPLWAGLQYLTAQPYDDAIISLSVLAVARGFYRDGNVSNVQSSLPNQEPLSGWTNEAVETAAWVTHPRTTLLTNLNCAVSSGIPAWRSISKPSDVAAFLQLYAAFLRRLREYTPQKMTFGISLSLWETVPILVKAINPQMGPNQMYRSRFSVEAVSLLKALDDRLTKWDEHMHEGFWAGLLAATEMESALIGPNEFDSEFIFETFTWYLNKLRFGDHVMGLDQYPNLLDYFSSKLKQELAQNGNRRWQQLLSSSYSRRLFSTHTDRIQNQWTERELGTYLVQWFQSTKTAEELRMCFNVIRDVVGTSAQRARKLMADGFASAAAAAMIQIRESSHPSGDDWSLRQQFVLMALILVWKWSQPATGKAWATVSLLSAISPAVIQLAGRMDAGLDSRSQPQMSVQGSTISDLELDIDRDLSACGDQLRRLIEDILRPQPVEALIARNLDVPLNRWSLSSNILLYWNYEAYSDHRSSLQFCSSFMYLNDGML